jgi:hypothetical protein
VAGRREPADAAADDDHSSRGTRASGAIRRC